MSIFRFLDNIPTVFFTIIWIGLLGAITLGAPYISIEDIKILITIKDNELVSNFSEFFNPHLIFLNIASKLTNFFGFNNYFLFRLPNFIYLGLLIFVSCKIIKLKFYDLNYLMPLTAVMLSGTILISMITIDGSLISGLVTLLIFYYLLVPNSFNNDNARVSCGNFHPGLSDACLSFAKARRFGCPRALITISPFFKSMPLNRSKTLRARRQSPSPSSQL